MPRGKRRIPAIGPKARDQLTRADTGETVTSVQQQDEPTAVRQRGEKVATPTRELLGTNKPDWGKIGVWVTFSTFVFGLVTAVIWSYADTVNSVRSLNDDVKDLKRKGDDLLRSSLDANARISAIERHQSDSANLSDHAAQQASSPPRPANR